MEVIRVNLVGTLALLDACEARALHVTNFATGCIYTYDAAHPVGGAPRGRRTLLRARPAKLRGLTA